KDRQRSPSPWACEHSKDRPALTSMSEPAESSDEPCALRHTKVPDSTSEIDAPDWRSSKGRSRGPQVHTTSSTRHPSPAAMAQLSVAPAAPVRALAWSAAASGSVAQQLPVPARLPARADAGR